jgi:sugar phosphate isomerase/epimerase
MFYGDLLPTAEKYGIMLMTENWDSDSTFCSTAGDLCDLMDAVDHPLLCACWDTAHGNIDKVARGIGQYENILTLGNRLKGLHISDNFGDVHHHSWPFAGIINFDAILQGLTDVKYDGYFTFEASYTLLHHKNIPYHRQSFMHEGKEITTLLDPSIRLKQKAVDLLYDIGEYILQSYGLFEE